MLRRDILPVEEENLLVELRDFFVVHNQTRIATEGQDNNSRLDFYWKQQYNDRARNIVNQVGPNFDLNKELERSVEPGTTPNAEDGRASRFNKNWFDANELKNPTKIEGRKGNRFPAKVEMPIVVYVYDKRIEGRVIDHSHTGLGVMLPPESGLVETKSVRILYQYRRQMAKVARVVKTDEGDQVGLKLLDPQP